MPYLIANNGPSTGKRYELRGAKQVMGRHPDCDVVIEAGAVSRYHAQIVNVGRDYFVEDLKSRNGTFNNEQLVERRTQLSNGDVIRVCDMSFTFHHEASPPPAKKAQVVEGSSSVAVLVDDEGNQLSGSTIMSTFDVSSAKPPSLQVRASAEAKLRALIEITSSLGRAVALDEVLPQVLNGLFKIFTQADRGFIVLKEDDGRLIPRWTKVRRGDETTLRISRTIVSQVMQSKEAILSADAASDARFELSQSIADFRIRSMMCAPLLNMDGESFGVLQIDTLDQRSRFQGDDLEVLASVASQAAISINNAQMHEAAVRQRAMERELELAHQVQRGFLPERPPQVSGYHFFDFYQPANHVGGDYYDYLHLADGRVAILVADVVGHGIAAALLMAKLSAEARYSIASEPTIVAAVNRLNDALIRMNLSDRFVTFILVVLDPKKHEVSIVNAGHNPPIRRRAKGTIEEPGQETSGLPLGISEGFEYRHCTLPIEPGELMLLYTDGLNEASNTEGEQYGIDRMRKHAATPAESVASLGRGLIEDIRRWVGDRPQSDDMCLVCFARSDGRDVRDPGESGIGQRGSGIGKVGK